MLGGQQILSIIVKECAGGKLLWVKYRYLNPDDPRTMHMGGLNRKNKYKETSLKTVGK